MNEDPVQEVGQLRADRPIAGRAEDKLGRSHFAEALADQIATGPVDESFVVGLLGPWGSGKTSILNMVQEALEERGDVSVLRFNPWLFSGTEQLVAHFFRELGAQLSEKDDDKLKELGARLEQYGELIRPLGVMPVIGAWATRIAAVGSSAGRWSSRRSAKTAASADEERKRLDGLLQEFGGRVVVLIDDIDRLRAQEVRDVMALVRLTADFPHTAYVLAFDRKRVEAQLGGDSEETGRAYLEKVVQVMHDVPVSRELDLAQAVLDDLNHVLDGRDVGPFDRDLWQNVFNLGMRPLFHTVRDVIRYTNPLPVTLKVVGDEVALVDVLALECLRILVPDAYALIPQARTALTSTGAPMGLPANQTHVDAMRAQIDAIRDAAGVHRDAVSQIIRRLFLASQAYTDNTHHGPEWLKTWRRERRVAHPDVLAFFLEKVLPAGVVTASKAQELFDNLGDEARLTDLLAAQSRDHLENALERLEDWEDEYPPEAVESAVVALLNQLHRLREGRRSMDDGGADLKLTRVVLRLVRRVEDENERGELVRRALPRVMGLSGRFELLQIVGHRENVGHKLVAPHLVEEREQGLHGEILSSPEARLADERYLDQLLIWAIEKGTEDDAAVVRQLIGQDPVFLGSSGFPVGEG